jgi:hypothetical protein
VSSTSGDVSTVVATVVGGSSYVWAVIGEGQNRIVAFTDYGKPYIARSTDSGAHWKKTAIELGTTGYFATAVSADGKYLEIVWADSQTRRMVLDPDVHAAGALPTGDVVSPTLSWLQCATGAVWLGLFESDTDYVIRRANAATASGHFKTQPYFTACSAEKLVLRSEDQDFACDASTCAPLSKLAAMPLVTVAAGDVLRYQTWDNVIALGGGDKPPVFARMPGNRSVAGVVDDRGTAIAILQAENRVEYAVLPK